MGFHWEEKKVVSTHSEHKRAVPSYSQGSKMCFNFRVICFFIYT